MPDAPKRSRGAASKLIFLAGPMFSIAERQEQGTLARLLRRAGFRVYAAHEDGFEMLELIRTMEDPDLQSEELYMASLMVQKIGWALEIYQISQADGLVLNMNGRVPDEGAVMEASMAFTAGKAVVNYKDSSVTMWGIFDNPMVAALDGSWQPVRKRAELVPTLKKALAAAAARPYTYRPPPHIREVIKLGEFVNAHKLPLRKALENATLDTKTSLAALAPLLSQPADIASVRKFLDALLAGGTLPAPASTARLGTPWPPPKQRT
jgi:nucleoside 2-deoxyribosyltransferase